MVPLTQSGAFPYTDPRRRVGTKSQLLERAQSNSLVLDVDTRGAFEGAAVEELTLEELFTILASYLDRRLAAVTEPFDVEPDQLRTFPMTAAQYLIFNQRTMHRSREAGQITRARLAISARYTLGTTLVYPQRRTGDPVDGSNLDICGHRCIRVVGTAFNAENAYL